LITDVFRSRSLLCTIHHLINFTLAGVENVPVVPAVLDKGHQRDRGGIFGGTGRFQATETALFRVPGGKATESQRLFRWRRETGIAQDCVVAKAVPFGPVSACISLLTGNFLHF
jgi:hypothetical protein